MYEIDLTMPEEDDCTLTVYENTGCVLKGTIDATTIPANRTIIDVIECLLICLADNKAFDLSRPWAVRFSVEECLTTLYDRGVLDDT